MLNNYRLEDFDVTKSYNGIKKLESTNGTINSFCKNKLKSYVSHKMIHSKILLDINEDDLFIGFFTLEMHRINKPSVVPEELSDNAKKAFKAAPNTIPVLRLTMIGVKEAYEGNGLGKKLLFSAIEVAYNINKNMNFLGLYLDGVEKKVGFYEYYNFVKIGERENTFNSFPMILHIDTINNLFED